MLYREECKAACIHTPPAQELHAALSATVNAMYIIPAGDKRLPPEEHLAAVTALCDGGAGKGQHGARRCVSDHTCVCAQHRCLLCL